MWPISIEQGAFFYCILINVIGFTAIVIDKYRAIRKKWRIKESRFFLMALLGGGIGVYMGMRMYRHKTRHRYFMWGIPAIVIFEWTLVYFYFYHW